MARHVADLNGPSSGAFTSCMLQIWYVVFCVLLDMSSCYAVVGRMKFFLQPQSGEARHSPYFHNTKEKKTRIVHKHWRTQTESSNQYWKGDVHIVQNGPGRKHRLGSVCTVHHLTICIWTNKLHKILVIRVYFLLDALHVSYYISPSSGATL